MGIVTTAVLGFVLSGGPDGFGGGAPQEDAPTATGALVRLGGVVVLVTLIGTAAGVLVSRSVTAPITRLAAAAQRIGAGELRTRVTAGGSRELEQLAHAFNTMAGDLQRAEELRANLMADVSHELRTPLTALEGNLRAALDKVYALDEAEIANLYSQTRHLIRLVNDLRELALAEAHQLPLDKTPTDLTALVDETLQVFAPLAEEQGVGLDRQLEHLPALRVDAMRIRQVLHNLLANALRHTPPGGRVTIVGRPQGDEVYLAVVDTGAGLGADQLELVFERFYRGDRSRSRDTGTTGLGLAIVKAIVEAHAGRMEAHSRGVGQGSTFALYLPQH
ncbi:MAG: ATP-binding protein [Chloroflexota bacterium]|nr:ATP-binding protein [Chloroflexota bacterium]